MHHKTLKALISGLKQGEFSSRELTAHYLERIKRHNPRLNAYISVQEEQALAEAQAADERRARGEQAPLLGVPLTHKDIFCTQGVKTTCGSRMLDNFIAPYDATCVSLLKNAGTVLLGKSNMDEFAMGSSNETSYYGPVCNPWDTRAVPGGSSGGSAAAVAARLTPVATATDTGGSIRQPAALCGITGLKPTYGRVSRYGMIAFASSLDQGGPMGKSAEDVAIMLNHMCGYDARDSTSVVRPPEDFCAALNQPLEGIKIGLPKEYMGEGLDPHVAALMESALQEYERLGATIKEIRLPNQHLAVPTYYVLAPAECSSNLARFDGVRYGYRCQEAKDLLDFYQRNRGEGFGAEVKRRIMMGTYVLSAGYYDAYYLKAQKLRRLISEDFKTAFSQVDLIMGPTSPTAAFDIGAKTDDPISMYLSDIYTISVNLAGLPGMSIPMGFIDGRPVGLQIIGNYFNESRMLNVAHQYQLATDWHLQAPEDFQ